jgi:IS5 family transposase
MGRKRWCADAGYTGAHKRDEIVEAVGSGEIRADIDWHVAQRRSVIQKMNEGPAKNIRRALERIKAQVRARVEHPFHVVKNLFRHRKTRYKGLAKNAAQLFSLFGLANLVIAKRRLMALDSHGKDAPA